MKKLLKYLLGFTAAAVITTAGAGTVSAAVAYGNCSENILNGGIIATDDSGKMYYADTEKANKLFAGDQMISSDAAENINVLAGTVYYTTDKGAGSAIMSVSKNGGMKREVLATSKPIEEMYADSEGTIWYLAGGQVYEREADADKSSVVAQGSITHFIPTSHGVIVSKGNRGSYTLCAGGQTIAGGVDSFYTYEGYLLFTKDGEDYQVQIHDLFNGFTPAAIRPYTLGDSTAAVKAFDENMTEDGDCPECAANAKSAVPQEADDADSVAPVKANGVTSMLKSGTISEGQYNIVLRARQQHEIQWTPKSAIKGWGNAYTFEAGTTYSGLPYGQPVGKGCYVPWKASLVEFANAVNDPSSLMYTSRASYNRSAPYYSCDCSSFVSWSWDLPSRQYTGSIAAYATEVTTKSIYSLQVGDAFNKSGSHVVLVSDIGYRGDEIVYIDIMEQTPPQTRYTRWGEGTNKTYNGTLSAFYSKYWGNGYKLIRCKTRDAAEYVPSAAVQLDGEVAPSLANSGVKLSDSTVKLNPSVNATHTLTYTKNSKVSGAVAWESSNENVATVGSTGKVTAKSAGMTVVSLYIGGALVARSNVYVTPAKAVVTGLKSGSAGSMTVSWNSVPSAATMKYEVLRKKADGTWENRGSATGNSFTDSGLAGYTSYTYSVRAVATTGNGTVLTGDYDTIGKTAFTMMDTPVLLKVTPKKTTTMKVAWLPVRGAKTYHVYRQITKSNGKKKWMEIGTTGKTYFNEKKLEKGETYTYTVRAFGGANGKSKSGYNPTGMSARMTAPTPELTSLTVSGKGSATLTWKKSKGAIGYVVYRSTGKKYVEIATVKDTKYTDSGLNYKKKYIYTVRAISKAGGKEILSGYDKAGLKIKMKLAAPKMVSATSKKTGEITVTWEDVKGAEAYMIYVKKSNGKWGTLVGTVEPKAHSYTVKGLASGSSYTYTVRAAWKIGSKYAPGFYDGNGVTATAK